MINLGSRVKIIKNSIGSVNKIGDVGIVTEIKFKDIYYRVSVTNRSITGNFHFKKDIVLFSNPININIKIL
jgi:hypothetical protein